MKRTVSILLAVVILALCIPGAALAANETQATTTVTYTVEDGYIINIPSSIDLNNSTCLEITASRMNTPGYIWVSIDTSRTAIPNNAMSLLDGSGHSLSCTLTVGDADGSGNVRGISNTDYRVAIFEPNSLTPTDYGKLYFSVDDSSAEVGTYTGTLYFLIRQ